MPQRQRLVHKASFHRHRAIDGVRASNGATANTLVDAGKNVRIAACTASIVDHCSEKQLARQEHFESLQLVDEAMATRESVAIVGIGVEPPGQQHREPLPKKFLWQSYDLGL